MTRLDVWLTEHGLAESREKAQALVMAGRVRIDGAPASKPGVRVREASAVLVDPGPAHVGRGARKLAGALDVFGVDPKGRVAVDVGASTGGFTETLLARGARRVYAVDVGRGQLHERIRTDPRVVVRDRTNARTLSAVEVPEPCSLAAVDVSFISLKLVLPAVRQLIAPDAWIVALIKPQFEAGAAQVGKGGVVRDPAVHAAVLRASLAAAAEGGLAPHGLARSPITGPAGNVEFLAWMGGPGPALDVERAIAAVLMNDH